MKNLIVYGVITEQSIQSSGIGHVVRERNVEIIQFHIPKLIIYKTGTIGLQTRGWVLDKKENCSVKQK